MKSPPPQQNQPSSSSSVPLLLSELCPYCNLQPPKYRCPACNARSCSLPCSKRHKAFNQCTGIRDPAKYVKRSQLLTPIGLDQDYNYLTTIEKVITHSPVRNLNEVIDEELKERTVRLKRVLTQVEGRGVNVKQVPAGLKRARENKTALTGSKKRPKTLKWTVEWIIQESEKERRILDERVSENLKLSVSLSTHLNNESKSERRRKLESLHLYLKDVSAPSDSPTLIRIPIDITLKEALQGKTVLEFPTIYVCGHVPEGFMIDEKFAKPPSCPSSATSLSSEEGRDGEKEECDNGATENATAVGNDGASSEDVDVETTSEKRLTRHEMASSPGEHDSFDDEI